LLKIFTTHQVIRNDTPENCGRKVKVWNANKIQSNGKERLNENSVDNSYDPSVALPDASPFNPNDERYNKKQGGGYYEIKK
jgi:hypothetical protein